MASGSPDPGPELAIVIPTYNERENVVPLHQALHEALKGIAWEAIFVDDDSTDGTAQEVRALSRLHPNVRCIRRIGRRGLSSAVIEGMLATSAPWIAVMDADLQHDEKLLPEMLVRLKGADCDLVVGSRMVEGGSNASLGGNRQHLSEMSSDVARRILGIGIRDLMSGFFMLRRAVVDDSVRNLSGVGFKILLDIVASSPRSLKVVELPYSFRTRRAGQSKLDSHAAFALGLTLIDKFVGRILPIRLVAFLLVGAFGVVVHFVTLTLAFKVAGLDFVASQALATLAAMTSNFAINNLFTYQDVRLRGRRWLTGWMTFTLICSLGALANVGVAATLFRGNWSWTLSALAGIVLGTAWNYGVTRRYTWRQ